MSATVPRINAHDIGAKLVLTVGLTLSYAVILLGARVHSRWKVRGKLEDYVLSLAVVSWNTWNGLRNRDNSGYSALGLPILS